MATMSAERAGGGWTAVCPCRRVTVALLFGLVSLSAGAGDWRLTDSFSARTNYVDRTGSSAQSGVVVDVTPRFRLNGKGGRSQANIDYGLTASMGTGNTDPKRFSHNLLGAGKIELIEDHFTLGGTARADLVGSSASSGPVDSINVNSDGRQVFSLELTPEFRSHLNRYADFVSRNSVSFVTYSGGNAAGNDDSSAYTLNAGVVSGRHFGAFDWSLDATRRETRFDTRTDRVTTFDAGLGYRFDAHWRARGLLGYEDNAVQTNRAETSGATYSAGVDWYPTPRTSISADIGKRYIGTVYSGAFKHRSKKTTLSLDLSHDVTNRRTEELVDQLFVLTDPTTGLPLLDPNTGAPILVNIPQVDQIDEDFVNTQLRGGVTVNGRRTTVTVTGNIANRAYEVSGQSEDSFGLTASISRRINPEISGSLRAGLTHTDGTAGGDSDTFDMQVSLSRRLSRQTSASVDFLHRNQDTSTPGGGYTENRIGLTFTTSFLR